ncbi:MAG: transcription antitermination factor NusB [Alphaproteobacteria bacterium]|nr:transcription antitermination factor NusB [Alphaproteobacteria bacterium]MCB9794408.1 transcription antitermination factor NusB [Alphaproteobacteria bacterium]
MASRRRARQYALQALFQADLEEGSGPEALEGLWGGILDSEDELLGTHRPEAEEMQFAGELVTGVGERRDELDARIQTASNNWRMARMSTVDRNILRLGAFEILHRADIPANVSINEAIELAKRYGSADSKSFVNGLLDRIARDAKRV